MSRLGLAIILVAVASGNAFSQQTTNADASKGCTFSEVYRKVGWAIPGMPAVPVQGKYPRKPYSDMPGVFVTALEPNPVETTITVIWCSRDDDGRLQIDDEPIGVISLMAYDFDGRVFAYAVRYGMQSILEGKRSQLGGVSQAIFYDLDGSGRFTLMRGPGGPIVPSFIPDWVRERPGSLPK